MSASVALKRLLVTPITDGPHETPDFVDDGIPFMSAESVKNGYLDFNLRRGNISRELHALYSQKTKPQRGDVFMVKSGATTGKVAIVETDQEFSIWSPLALMRANKRFITPGFLYYALKSHQFQRQVENSWSFGTQQNIGMQVIGNLAVPRLDIAKQKKIVEHLDEKTAIIDKMIAAKNHTHTQLLELRQAIIQNLTNGRGAGMKMKNINSWVGEIPEHWLVTKLSHVAQIKTGGTPSRDNLAFWSGGDIPWLASGEVNKEVITTVDNHITTLGMASSNASWLPVDTVMIALNGQGKTKGMAALLKTPAACNQSLAGIICDERKLIPEYLYYYLKGKYADIRGLKGEARDGLNLDIIGSIPVALPPVSEQKEIAERIKKEITKLDATRDKLQISTKLLEEYRSSLISNVVAGKVEI